MSSPSPLRSPSQHRFHNNWREQAPLKLQLYALPHRVLPVLRLLHREKVVIGEAASEKVIGRGILAQLV
jgi:hypothetical protein